MNIVLQTWKYLYMLLIARHKSLIISTLLKKKPRPVIRPNRLLFFFFLTILVLIFFNKNLSPQQLNINGWVKKMVLSRMLFFFQQYWSLFLLIKFSLSLSVPLLLINGWVKNGFMSYAIFFKQYFPYAPHHSLRYRFIPLQVNDYQPHVFPSDTWQGILFVNIYIFFFLLREH